MHNHKHPAHTILYVLKLSLSRRLQPPQEDNSENWLHPNTVANLSAVATLGEAGYHCKDNLVMHLPSVTNKREKTHRNSYKRSFVLFILNEKTIK